MLLRNPEVDPKHTISFNRKKPTPGPDSAGKLGVFAADTDGGGFLRINEKQPDRFR